MIKPLKLPNEHEIKVMKIDVQQRKEVRIPNA